MILNYYFRTRTKVLCSLLVQLYVEVFKATVFTTLIIFWSTGKAGRNAYSTDCSTWGINSVAIWKDSTETKTRFSIYVCSVIMKKILYAHEIVSRNHWAHFKCRWVEISSFFVVCVVTSQSIFLAIQIPFRTDRGSAQSFQQKNSL